MFIYQNKIKIPYIYIYNYKNCQKEAGQGGTSPQSFFHQHILSVSEGHHGLVNDCEITVIDKTDFSDPSRRKVFWI